MADAIVVEDVVKSFPAKRERGLLRRGPVGETTAVDHVSFRVREGEFFGLLGPNGAGKTTLVKLLSTLLLPTSGRVEVGGHDAVRDADAVRRDVGVVLGGERALYWRLTARENLRYFTDLYDIPAREAARRVDELLGLVGLADRADERVETYSKGMKQRLHVARGLLHRPRVLLLDEPSIGLDPHAARSVRALVRSLADAGTTILLTTHYLHEADELSDRVAILHRGRLVALDTPEALKRSLPEATAVVLRVGAPPADLEGSLRAVAGVTEVARVAADADSAEYRLLATAPDEAAAEVARLVPRAGGSLLGLTVERPSLEDVFVRLTGQSLQEEGP